MVNEHESRALNTSSYMSTMQSVIKALAYRNISVMISLHTLNPNDYGGLWYNGEISEADYTKAVQTLTKNLCSATYWNVLGLDLKNEPWKATWGTNDIKTDFRLFAQRIGNEMLRGCPNWLAFVEGIAEINSWYSADLKKTYWYQEWWGGGLSKAKNFPVTLSKANKVVYAPHYYTSAVYPADYFYGDNYKELPDNILKNHVVGTINAMFGYLKKVPKWPAMVLGEFGGLYTTDRHPKKTIQRTFKYTIELITKNGYSGGYVWSLNPESGYGYNPGKTEGKFQEGLVDITWRKANEPYLNAIKPLEKLPSFGPLKCFPRK
jgi:endoglucanase